jgi:hypothetical protein
VYDVPGVKEAVDVNTPPAPPPPQVSEPPPPAPAITNYVTEYDLDIGDVAKP